MQGTIFEVESFLHENYLFRRNVLSGKTEVAPMAANNGKEPLWKAVTPEVMNSIARHAMKSGVGGSRSSKVYIEEYICSDDIPGFNPIRDYLESLPAWDGENHVANLFGRIPGITSEQLSWCSVWLRSAVAHWMGMDPLHGNEYVPVLIGHQGCGKSTFAMRILPDHLQTFVTMLMSTPIVTLPQLKSHMCLLTQTITQASLTEDDILFSDSASQIPYSAEKLSHARFRQRESADPHAATNYENGVCDAIALGRTDLLIPRLTASPGGSVGMMSPDAMRQRRYSFISFATLITRAAIRRGLPEETAFLLSDLYCQRMDSLTSPAAMDQLTLGMAMDFCEKVAKSRLPQQVSPVVQKALSYITVHLHESFGMEELSQYCNLCRRSLSLRFQKEVGMTVGEYVQREKTEEARFLLRHTKIGLPEIAAYLDYSSQSYFTQIFRKHTGKTPQQYRVGAVEY